MLIVLKLLHIFMPVYVIYLCRNSKIIQDILLLRDLHLIDISFHAEYGSKFWLGGVLCFDLYFLFSS